MGTIAAKTDTRQVIMDAARATVQALGYNALSFRELAKVVGIKSASIHYHFPSKGDLGAALARRYTDDAAAFFNQMLAAGEGTDSCMRQYTAVFRAALENDNRMCLCGIMNAEHDALPAEVRLEVDRFTEVNVAWLQELLARGAAGGDPAADLASLRPRALAIFAAIGGAQLVARGRGDVALFDQSLAAYRAAGLLPTA